MQRKKRLSRDTLSLVPPPRTPKKGNTGPVRQKSAEIRDLENSAKNANPNRLKRSTKNYEIDCNGPERNSTKEADKRLRFYKTHKFHREKKLNHSKTGQVSQSSRPDSARHAKLGKRKSDELFGNAYEDEWPNSSRLESAVQFEHVQAKLVESESVSENEQEKRDLRPTRLGKRNQIQKTFKKWRRTKRSLKSKILKKRRFMKHSKNKLFLWEMTRHLSTKFTQFGKGPPEHAQRKFSLDFERNEGFLTTDLDFVGNFSEKIINENFLIRKDSLRKVITTAISQFNQEERELAKFSLKREIDGHAPSENSEDDLREGKFHQNWTPSTEQTKLGFGAMKEIK